MKLANIITALRVLHTERDEEIIRLYSVDNASVAEIAREAGMQTSSIARLLERCGIRDRRKTSGRPRNDA